MGRVHRGHERAVPKLAEDMLRMIAFGGAARAEALVDRPPGFEVGQEGPRVPEWRAASAGGQRHPRIALLIQQAAAADVVELVGDHVQRLVPGDFRPARILIPTLLRIGSFHRLENAVGIIQLLDLTIWLDAHLAVGGGLAF